MAAPKVAIIDYGVGNLLSVRRGIEYSGADAIITNDHDIILSTSHVVLPGVGAFAKAMKLLEELGLIEVIASVVRRGTPFLGICLGMQLLLSESMEFGYTKGLDIIPGKVVPIIDSMFEGEKLKIPHIGWAALNKIELNEDIWGKSILKNIQSREAVYFIHSFMGLVSNPTHCIADCEYGGQAIAAVIKKENVTGCQFHPEKSGETGLKILKNFLLM